MSKKQIGLVLLGIGLGAAAWVHWQPEIVERWFAPSAAFLRSSAGAAVAGVAGSVPPLMRKCKTATAVEYTDGECPGGSREQAVGGGTVTVVPGQRVMTPASAAAPAAPASARSLLKELAGPQGSTAIKNRMIEQAMQR